MEVHKTVCFYWQLFTLKNISLILFSRATGKKLTWKIGNECSFSGIQDSHIVKAIILSKMPKIISEKAK